MKEKYSFFGTAKTKFRESGRELGVIKNKDDEYFRAWFLGIVLGDKNLEIFDMDKDGDCFGYRDIPKDIVGRVMYINLHLELWDAKYKYHSASLYNDKKFKEAAEKALSKYFDNINEYKASNLIKKR